jgi:hypothetical protein
VEQQLIYRKTALGDEAIQSRAKLSEHELRVILIMVDGKKTVGEIVSKFGNLQSVEHALYRLEGDGFIAPTDGHVSDLELERTNTQIQSLFARATKDARVAPSLEASLPAFIQPPAVGEKPDNAVDTSALFKATATAPNAVKAKPLPSAVPVVDIPAMPSDEAVLGPRATTSPVRTLVPDPPAVVSAASQVASRPVPAAPVRTPAPTDNKQIKPIEPKSVRPISTQPVVAADPEPSSWDEEDEPRKGPLPPLLDADDIRRHARPPADEKPDSVVRPAEPPRSPSGGKPNPFAASGPATAGGFEQSWPEEPRDKPPPRPLTVPFQFPRRRRGLGKKLLWLGVLLLLALLIGFVVYPFDSHRADLEAMLSQATGQPVRMGRLRASLSPSPAFVIEQIEVGQSRDVVIRETRAVPDLFSLLGGRKSFSEIRFSGVKVPLERLGLLSAAAGGLGASADVAVRELRFQGVSLEARDLVLANYSGRAELDDGGRLRLLALVNSDGTLEISVVGDAQGNAQVVAEGTGWKPSPSSPFVFESIQASGSITGAGFRTDRIEGRLFGGVVKGSLGFAWGETMALETDIASEFMNTPVLLTALGVPAVVEGDIDGRVRFAVKADNWAKLVASVPMEGDFLASKGNLRGMDLVEAVRRAGSQPYRGGGTKFDTLKGRFAWDGKALRLSQLDLASGIVGAFGALRIDADTNLEGEVNVVIKASTSRTREPVSISGTLKDPLLVAGR